MRVTTIEIEGEHGDATLRRLGDEIRADVHTQRLGRYAGLVHKQQKLTAGAGNEKEQNAMARAIQEALDGCRGCAGDVAGYRIAIQMLAD